MSLQAVVHSPEAERGPGTHWKSSQPAQEVGTSLWVFLLVGTTACKHSFQKKSWHFQKSLEEYLAPVVSKMQENPAYFCLPSAT